MPKHGSWAFAYPRTGPSPWKDAIPSDTNILVTHGPPKSHLDVRRLGCEHLLREMWSMANKPVLHVFGHIHGGYGQEMLFWDPFQAAYESAMNHDASWVNLFRLVF